MRAEVDGRKAEFNILPEATSSSGHTLQLASEYSRHLDLRESGLFFFFSVGRGTQFLLTRLFAKRFRLFDFPALLRYAFLQNVFLSGGTLNLTHRKIRSY